MTFGKQPLSNLGRRSTHKKEQDSPGTIDEEEETESKKINASTGKRKQVNTEDSQQKLEHTFGDDGSLSFQNSQSRNNINESRISESKQVNSTIPWTSKADISLSTDSIFNLQDEEMQKFLKQENLNSSAKKTKQQSIEVLQMLTFMTMIEEMWQGILDKHPSALKFQKKGEISSQAKFDQVPQEISAALTHQITQISVYFQLNSEKEDFELPTKKVSQIAKIAKQIVI